MSRRKNDFVEGCVGQLWPLFIIFAPIIYLLNFLLENIGIVLIVVLIVGAIIAIVAAANSAAKKRAAVEAERQRNLNIVNASEKKANINLCSLWQFFLQQGGKCCQPAIPGIHPEEQFSY